MSSQTGMEQPPMCEDTFFAHVASSMHCTVIIGKIDACKPPVAVSSEGEGDSVTIARLARVLLIALKAYFFWQCQLPLTTSILSAAPQVLLLSERQLMC